MNNEETNTLQTEVKPQVEEANPNGENAQPQANEGKQEVQTQVQKMEGKTYTQKQFDDAMAGTRGATEKETKKKLLAMLGLKADEEDKLKVYKEAYENSLSEEEKKTQEMANLQTDNETLKKQLEEKDYVIKALVEMTGKKESDVSKIVKMAKGLKTEDNSIEDAIRDVIEMIKPEPGKSESAVTMADMPVSQVIEQPSDKILIDTKINPFDKRYENLTEQSRLWKNNPELAKRLQNEARGL